MATVGMLKEKQLEARRVDSKGEYYITLLIKFKGAKWVDATAR